MLAAQPAQEFGAWVTGEHPLKVEYSKEALARIRAAVVDAFMALPHGGLEIGGVLLGTHGESSIRVMDFRTIECEHALSPKFVLSKNDESKLVSQLSELTSADASEESQVVGWFVSHSRSDLKLTPRDLELHNQYFPEPHQVILVLKPYKWDPTRAGFFVREADGTMRADAPYREFTIEAPAPPPRETSSAEHATPPEPVKPEAATIKTVVPEAPARHSILPAPAAIQPSPAEPRLFAPVSAPPRRSRRISTLVAGVAVMLAAALLIGAAVFTSYYMSTRPYLRVAGSTDQIAIEWDRSGQSLRGVTGASLEITDGPLPPQVIPLDPSGLAKGTLLYSNSSDQVQVRLKVTQGGTTRIEDTALFIRQPRPAQAPQPPPALQSDGPVETQRPATLAAQRPYSASRPAGSTASRTVAPKAFQPPPSTQSQAQAPVALNVPPPNIQVPQQAEPSIPSSNLLSLPSPSAVPPAAKPPAPVQQPAPQGPQFRTDRPASGRAIWTGNLPKDGILLFANGRPSSGTLTGQLPNGPMRVRIYPGELAKGGIVVYSPGDPEFEDFNLTEAPGPANGWNQTQFKRNKRRSTDLSLLEVPSPQNNWTKIVLRNAERPLGVIFVEWEACRSAEQCLPTQRAENRD